MHIVPVVDLRAGLAVSACRGMRAQYQPLSTSLCPDGSARTLVSAYRRLYGFQTIYIADLDAIEGTGNNAQHIRALATQWPQGEIWCDHGMVVTTIPEFDSAQSGGASGRKTAKTRIILGSESQNDWRVLRELAMTRPADFILSLDYCDHQFLGPDRLEQDPSCWPERMIVMMLDRVGTARGPALDRLERIIEQAGGRHVYAAGGIRNMNDLRILQSIGVCGALVATALHDGGLSPGDWAGLDTQKQSIDF